MQQCFQFGVDSELSVKTWNIHQNKYYYYIYIIHKLIIGYIRKYYILEKSFC